MYNAGIILAGQSPDIMGNALQGLRMGAAQQEIQQGNALRSLYQQHGAGIAQGDQTSLNALAQLDPMAAMDAQRTQLGMQATRQSMDVQRQQLAMQQEQLAMARAEGERAAQQLAAQMEASQLQAQQEQIQQGLAAAMTATTPQQWDQLAQQFGAEELVGQFENREAIIAYYSGLDETLTRMQPQNPEFRVVGSDLLQLNAEGGPAVVHSAERPAGSSITLPDGTRLDLDGGAQVPSFDVTEGEGRNASYALRAQESNAVLAQLEGEGTDFVQNLTGRLPLVGNYTLTPERQQYEQAQRDFINAVLRRESGAVISEEEFDNARRQYFPQPGDSPEVIEQKRRNRETAIEGMVISSGPASEYVQGRNPQSQPQQPAQPAQQPQQGTQRPPEVAEGMWSGLSPEEQQQLLAIWPTLSAEDRAAWQQ